MEVIARGTAQGGVAWESVVLRLVRVADGRLVHTEAFEAEDRERALARLDELAGAAAA